MEDPSFQNAPLAGSMEACMAVPILPNIPFPSARPRQQRREWEACQVGGVRRPAGRVQHWPDFLVGSPRQRGATGCPTRSLLVACPSGCPSWLAGQALRYWRIQPGPTESRTSTAPDLARRQDREPRRLPAVIALACASDKLAPQVLDSHIVGLRVDLARATVGLRVSSASGGQHGRGTARLCRAPRHAGCMEALL